MLSHAKSVIDYGILHQTYFTNAHWISYPFLVFQQALVCLDIRGDSPFYLTGAIAMKTVSVALGLLLLSLNANAVSFDCNKASTAIEKEICSDSLLGELDDKLAQNYKYMLAANIGDGAKKDLKATQKKWLAVRNKCANKACLVDAYRQRMDEVCEYPVLSGMHPVCTSSDEI